MRYTCLRVHCRRGDDLAWLMTNNFQSARGYGGGIDVFNCFFLFCVQGYKVGHFVSRYLARLEPLFYHMNHIRNDPMTDLIHSWYTVQLTTSYHLGLQKNNGFVQFNIIAQLQKQTNMTKKQHL